MCFIDEKTAIWNGYPHYSVPPSQSGIKESATPDVPDLRYTTAQPVIIPTYRNNKAE